MDSETIFALASGAGRAAIAVIRISGPATAALVGVLCGKVPVQRVATLCSLRDPASGALLDRALVLWFPAPNSFTGEDCAEFHVHGGRAVLSGVLTALGQYPHCRLAEPGEFTRRAFLHGKMDLTGVEGLADLIEAETRAQRDQALRQLDGPLGRQAETWRAAILQASALIEADIDFVDEGDVGSLSFETIRHLLQPVRDAVRTVLTGDNRQGERLRDGFTIVVAGPPNAGKSSLFNALARRDVALVSPFPGTTRDVLEVYLDLDGLPIVLVDTAGIRDSLDPVEQAGIARAHHRLATADLVFWLRPIDDETTSVAPANARIVTTKFDLTNRPPNPGEIVISTITGAGLQNLLNHMADVARQALTGAETSVITRERHRSALRQAELALGRILDTDQQEMIELVAEDMRVAARSLGRITGLIETKDVLDAIFSRFCIGK